MFVEIQVEKLCTFVKVGADAKGANKEELKEVIKGNQSAYYQVSHLISYHIFRFKILAY